MITRAEAKQDLDQKLQFGILKIKDYVDKIYDSVEKRIAELETPNTCEGCRYVGYFSPHESLECGNKDCNFYGCDVDITDGCLKFEPKEQL